jgi:hypothetical protein
MSHGPRRVPGEYTRKGSDVSVDADIIHIETMYGARSETPYVKLTWGDKEAILTPAEAIKHAVRIIEVAANSEGDAAFIRFIRERIGMNDPEQLAAMMRDFRAMRS